MDIRDIDHVIIDVWTKQGKHHFIDTRSYKKACKWLDQLQNK